MLSIALLSWKKKESEHLDHFWFHVTQNGMDSIKFIAFPPFLTEVQGLIYVPSFWLYPILPLLRKDFLKFQRFYLINYKKQIDIHIFYLKISEWDKHIPYNRLYLNCKATMVFLETGSRLSFKCKRSEVLHFDPIETPILHECTFNQKS